jgi:hypothetical protein
MLIIFFAHQRSQVEDLHHKFAEICSMRILGNLRIPVKGCTGQKKVSSSKTNLVRSHHEVSVPGLSFDVDLTDYDIGLHSRQVPSRSQHFLLSGYAHSILILIRSPDSRNQSLHMFTTLHFCTEKITGSRLQVEIFVHVLMSVLDFDTKVQSWQEAGSTSC